MQTPAELAAALETLRRRLSLSYKSVEKAATKPGTRGAHLSKSTVGEMVTGVRLPTRERLLTFLAACGVVGAAETAPWLDAWERASSVQPTQSSGALRVREAWPHQLGVHLAMSGETLPEYVGRKFDQDVRDLLRRSSEQGGLILLVGPPAVGKSRSLYEAVRTELPEWWLIHPADSDELAALVEHRTMRTVVWLDDLDRFLGPTAVPGAIRKLVHGGTVVVGTMRAEQYARRLVVPPSGWDDLSTADRQLLGLASVVDVPAHLTAREVEGAGVIAVRDHRIRAALRSGETNLVQELAHLPQIIDRWRHANSYARAVILTLVEARRLGVQGPVNRTLLAAAAPGYLTLEDRAAAPSDWLDAALDYASAYVSAGPGPLVPVAEDVGAVIGYHVADALVGEVAASAAAVPEVVWRAFRRHLTDAHDLLSVGHAARKRMRLRHAEALYTAALAQGLHQAAACLVEILHLQGRVGERDRLARCFGAQVSQTRPTRLLGPLAHPADLRARVEAADPAAAVHLVESLIQGGRVAGAIEALSGRVEAGDTIAASRMVDVLVYRGHAREVGEWLREFAELYPSAAVAIADDSFYSGRFDEVARILAPHFQAGDAAAVSRVAELLAVEGRIDDLRALADSGLPIAAGQLAWLLAERGEFEELRARAAAGDSWAASRLDGQEPGLAERPPDQRESFGADRDFYLRRAMARDARRQEPRRASVDAYAAYASSLHRRSRP
ncbi:hypothetical protein ACFYL6_06220 [Micromonospora sp. NPDC007208]|uniref:hypothetical protein n=1 Tax=Micromonospora sp. NPDC007208 TaxID=3364236 RepID=UPI00369E1DA5